MSNKKHPKVGIGIMVKKGNKVLMGLRKGAHGSGSWCFPGGHQDFGETMEECAKRELREETGINAKKLKLISIADEMRYIKSDGKQFVNVGFLAQDSDGEPQVMEPEKCIEWKWFDLDQLPENLFETTGLILKNYLTKKIYQKTGQNPSNETPLTSRSSTDESVAPFLS